VILLFLLFGDLSSTGIYLTVVDLMYLFTFSMLLVAGNDEGCWSTGARVRLLVISMARLC